MKIEITCEFDAEVRPPLAVLDNTSHVMSDNILLALGTVIAKTLQGSVAEYVHVYGVVDGKELEFE